MNSNPVSTIKKMLQIPLFLDQLIKDHQETIGSMKPRTQVVFNINKELKEFIIPFSISNVVETGESRLTSWRYQLKRLENNGGHLTPKHLDWVWFHDPVLLTPSEQREALKKFDYFLLTQIQNAIANDPALYDIGVLMEGYVDLVLKNFKSVSPRPFYLTINGLD